MEALITRGLPDDVIVDEDGYPLIRGPLDVKARQEDGREVLVKLGYREGYFGPQPIAVTLENAEPDQGPIEGRMLRSLNVTKLIADDLRHRCYWYARVDDGTYIHGQLALPAGVDSVRKEAGLGDDTLGLVARVYDLAVYIGDHALRALQDAFGATRSTANFWVSTARERGLIGEAEARIAHTTKRVEARPPFSRQFADALLEAAVADLVDKGLPEVTARRRVGGGVPAAPAAAPAPAADDGAAAAADSDGVAQALAQAGVPSPDAQAKVLAEFKRRGVSRAEVAAMPFHELDRRLEPVLDTLGMLDG